MHHMKTMYLAGFAPIDIFTDVAQPFKYDIGHRHNRKTSQKSNSDLSRWCTFLLLYRHQLLFTRGFNLQSAAIS